MPELPEVEAARRAIEENCLGKKIKRAIVANDSKVIDGVSPSDFEASLLGKTILSAHRKGKNLWLCFDSPPFPSFQFGMTGAIYIKGVAVTKYKRSTVKDSDEWPSKYSKFFVELVDGMELSFTDKRRFARVRLLKDPALVPPISELGPDALLEPMMVDEFAEALKRKKIAIKALLLDQNFIAGIGNWVADEVLYHARIHPLQVSSSLSKESCAALNKSIKEVIEKAVEVEADSSQFPSNWIFHSREKKPGKAFVDGKKIEFITAGGRTTAYVPELQKLSGNQAGKASGEPKKRNSKRKTGDEDDEDTAERPNEEEETTRAAKAKKGQKLGASTKNTSRKRKSPSDEDDYDGNADGADAKHCSDGDDDEDDNRDNASKPKTRKVAGRKGAKDEKGSKIKVGSSKTNDVQGDQDDAKKPTTQKFTGGEGAKAEKTSKNKVGKSKTRAPKKKAK